MNPPNKVAIESNVWQQMSADWMKRDDTFQYLARRIEKIGATQVRKVTRIFNDIYSGLEDETLWLDPEDEIFRRCALRYDASDPDKQWDDPLDCVAMGIQSHKYNASTLDDQAMSRLAAEQASQFSGEHDGGTWIDMTTNLFSDAQWN